MKPLHLFIHILSQETHDVLSRITVIQAFDIFSVLETLESVRHRLAVQVRKTFSKLVAATLYRPRIILYTFLYLSLSVLIISNSLLSWVEI